MTQKLKNRLHKMTFQKHHDRRTLVEEIEDDKYYEELYRKRTLELLGLQHENMERITGRGIRPQHI